MTEITSAKSAKISIFKQFEATSLYIETMKFSFREIPTS